MSSKKYFIKVCLGSACFSRGNRKLTGIINQFLKDHKLEELTDFRGKQCLDMCAEGPILIINEVVYKEVTELNIEAILRKAFRDELLMVK